MYIWWGPLRSLRTQYFLWKEGEESLNQEESLYDEEKHDMMEERCDKNKIRPESLYSDYSPTEYCLGKIMWSIIT